MRDRAGLTGCGTGEQGSGLKSGRDAPGMPNENININKINKIYIVDFIGYFISI